ncbi:MAG: 50S ribosomal protein L25/general stress protein Ctc [Pseudomonadota bacterium]|nr:50S ribosomal protein L25/general stress protein Ctc [Pseudomonadota bacterium]
MAKVVSLKAAARARSGKGAARAVRREGLVPAVVYGDRKEPELVALNRRDLTGHVGTGRFTATLVDLDVGGKTVRVIPREVQFEPVRDAIMHVDFLRLGKDARVRVEIPVHFQNHEASPGLKAGGVLNIVRHEIECFCPADNIPDEILIDLTGLHIGQPIHISSVKMPEGVKPAIAERDFTVATIATAAVLTAEEEAGVAPGAAEVPAIAQKEGEDAAAPGAPGAAPGAPPAAGAKEGAKDAKPAVPAQPSKKEPGDKKK